MAYQAINLDTANSGSGDPLRDGGVKIDANFQELYSRVSSTRNASSLAKVRDMEDGVIAVVAGLLYESDSTVPLNESAGEDLSIAGIKPAGAFTPQHYGQVPSNSNATDSYASVNRCFQAAKRYGGALGYVLPGGGTNFRHAYIDMSRSPVYALSQTVVVDGLRAVITMGKSAVVPINNTHSGTLISLTGNVGDVHFEKGTFESTGTGCIQVAANNVSGSRVTFDQVRFTNDRFGLETGKGVIYTSRSSQLSFIDCFFNEIRHPFHIQNADAILAQNCWWGFAKNAVYPDRSAYILLDKGHLVIQGDNVFAGGPGFATNALAAPNGSETAFINMGIEGAAAPDEDHARVTIRDSRIGLETGNGTLVNCFVEHKGTNGSDWRTGVVLENIQCSNDEQKIAMFDGTNATPLVRIFDMPHQVIAKNIHSNVGNICLLGIGSTAVGTSAQLRALLDGPMDPTVIPDDQLKPKQANHFRVDDVTATNVYLIGGTGITVTEYNRWAEIFGRFNYHFASDAPGASENTTEAIIETWNTDFVDTGQIAGTTYDVDGSAVYRVPTNTVQGPVRGTIFMEWDQNADTLYAFYDDLVDYSSLPIGLNVDAGFMVSGVFQSTVTAAQAATATLAVRVRNATNPGVDNIRCRGLTIEHRLNKWRSKSMDGVIQAA